MNTIKRYWSTLWPIQLERMTKEQIIEHKLFDAKLTPEDIIEMQTIDADCNDCRHFQRGAMRKGLGISCFEGRCLKLDKPTLAWPMQFSDHPCFEHRRGRPPTETPRQPEPTRGVGMTTTGRD